MTSRRQENRVETFSRFLAALRKLTDDSNRGGGRSLERFIAEFARLRQLAPSRPHVERVDVISFEKFIRAVGSLAQRLRMRGDFIDVWAVAGLKRKEVRNAAVLAWLLDPKETHGRGATIFCTFMGRLAQRCEGRFPLPATICGNYLVLPENTLGGSRIDITIDGPDFIAFIEVKVDAPERDGQVPEYLSLAQGKAAGRPYCVVFLSSQRPSIDSPNIVAATWSDVAIAIEEAVGRPQGSSMSFGDRLLNQFAQYIRMF